MTYGFLDVLSAPSVRAAQAVNGSLEMWEDFNGHRATEMTTHSARGGGAAAGWFALQTFSP